MITLFGGLTVLAFLTGVFLILNVVAMILVVPLGITEGLDNLGGYLWNVNTFLPVTELMQSLAFALLVAFAVFTLKTGFWVIALLRGNSMPGSK